MTATDHDLAALLAALDAGDDSALPAVADALEEAGDPRAAGLRLVGDRRPTRQPVSGHWSWDRYQYALPRPAWWLPDRVFCELRHHGQGCQYTGVVALYPTSHDAFFALAMVLTSGALLGYESCLLPV